MTNRPAKNRTPGEERPLGPEVDEALRHEDGADLPASKAAHAAGSESPARITMSNHLQEDQ